MRFSVFCSICIPAMVIYQIPFTKPSPYSVLLSVSLLSLFVGTLLAKFRVERQAQLTFHSTFDLLAVFILICITGASTSPFSFLFVFVIAASGALLSVAGGVLSAVAATILYALASSVGPRIGVLGIESPFAGAESVDGIFMLIDIGLHATLYIFVGLINGLLAGKLRKVHITVSELEGELKRLKLETRDILRNIGSGIFTCDLSERVLYINPAAKRILGVEDENVVGKPVSFLLEERSPNFYRFVQKSLSGKKLLQKSYEFPSQLPGGQSTIIGASASLLRDRSSKKKGVTVICQDIAQKKALQEMTTRAQKMELMADISTMLAKEIVPPISMVKNSLRILASERSYDGRDTKIIEDLLDQLESMSRILWDFQTFSRIKVAEWKPVLCGDVIRETFDLLKHHPEFSSAVHIELRGDERRSLIWGDRELLKQAFMNLFIQSCKKMGRKGLVEVELSPPPAIQNSRGEFVENGGQMMIFLQENGTVITEENIDHLGPSYTPTFYNGNGLRIAIVDKILTAHMGKFLYEDVEGKGTKFTIILPVTKPV